MSSSTSVRTRHPKSVTRATILNKAYELYRNRELVHGDERLSLVLDQLGYTTGAGYQIWANQAEFRRELQVYVAENIEYASLHALEEEIQRLDELDLEFEEQVLAGGDAYANMFLGREEFYLTLRFFAMDEDRHQQITDALVQGYERLTWETRDLFERVLRDHKRRILDGLTVEDMAVAATALIEGYALRARVQPGRIRSGLHYRDGSHHPFSIAFLGLVLAFTEKVNGEFAG